MDYSNNTGTLDQADEDILTSTLSDEALEAAAGIETMAAGTAAAPGFPCDSGIWPFCQ
jgi:hypothetical protein